MDLNGKTVFVTGAARGIGAESARRLAARGANVALAGLEPEELARVAAELLAEYRAGGLDLECLMAFTVTDDHARQLKVYRSLQGWQRGSAGHIRRLLTEMMVEANDKLARFVGLDAYEAAGGGPVDRGALRWWETLGTLKWGIMCITQTVTHTSGALRSVELAAIARSLHAHVNLIPLNPTAEYDTPGSPIARVREFRDLLKNLGANATVRQNRGTDIDAACGQLRASHTGDVGVTVRTR